MMWTTEHDIETFIRAFEACTLPKARWTHHAHLVVALWYLKQHSFADALDIVRRRIRAYNEAVGTPNTDHTGYHETLTRLFLRGVSGCLSCQPDNNSLPIFLEALFKSPVGDKDWPLRFYTHEHLLSVTARRQWVEPDLASNEDWLG